MLNQGSREIASSSQPLLPGGARLLAASAMSSRPMTPSPKLRVHAQLHRAARQAPQLIVGPEDLRLDARHHARDGLIGDLREGLLAEGEEGEIGAVAEQQELEVVMPHPEVPLEGLLVRLEEIVVGGDAPAGMHVLERLEVRQLPASAAPAPRWISASILSLPLRVQTLPVLVVVEGALLELLRAARDLLPDR